MPRFQHLLSRRWLFAFLGVASLLLGLAMLHPYPRQSLFGPKIRGKPWCFWEAQVRHHVQREKFEKTPWARSMHWLRIAPTEMDSAELFNHAEMLPLLLHLINDPNPAMRRGVASQFFWHAKLQDKSAVPSLRARLDDVDSRCRIEAAMALTQIEPGERNFRVLLQILDDPTSDSRFAAMDAMRFMVNDEFFDTFVGYAKHGDPSIRSQVMFTLYRFGKKGVPMLVQGLNDPILAVRRDAMESLGAIDAKEAVPALERLLNDKDVSVRTAAVAALASIEPERFGHLKAKE